MTFKEATHKKFDSIKPKLGGKNQSGEWIRQLENHAFGEIGRLKVRKLTVVNTPTFYRLFDVIIIQLQRKLLIELNKF